MKNLFLVVTILVSFHAVASAARKKVVLDVNFERSGKGHHYFITETYGKKPDFVMTFINEKRKVKTLKLSQAQALAMKRDAVSIIWENQYRKPSSSENCLEYARIKTDSEKTKICYENKTAVGRAFGYLNALNSVFR
jgi:hypothetical protein